MDREGWKRAVARASIEHKSIVADFSSEYIEKLKSLADNDGNIFTQMSFGTIATLSIDNDDHISDFIVNKILEERNATSLPVWRFRYVFNNYKSIKGKLRWAITKYEGRVCCVDKAISLLDYYLKTELDIRLGHPDIPIAIFPINAKNNIFWVQPHSVNLWFKFVDSIVASETDMSLLVESNIALNEYYKNPLLSETA